MYKIYSIRNKTNNKQYIGYTSLELQQRWKLHQNKSSSKMAIYKAIQKYGCENFEITLLEEYNSKQHAIKREIALIEELQPSYNIHRGGTGGPMFGPMNGMWGKTHTPEIRALMSERMRGANNINYGTPRSEEVRHKISKTRIERNIPSPFKGRKHSEASKAKMRKPWTEEQKKKIRTVYCVDGVDVTNAKQFCEDNGHNYACFTQAAKNNKVYKGMSVMIKDTK